jgi:hypothetical protein
MSVTRRLPSWNSCGIKQESGRSLSLIATACGWDYRGKRQLNDITDTGSIILKQKIEIWARKARELGIEPVLKISRNLDRGLIQ